MSESVVTLRTALEELKRKAKEDRNIHQLAVRHADSVRRRYEMTMDKIRDMEEVLSVIEKRGVES